MGRIFISHANADKELVEAFVTLLQTGLDISRNQIFCSSIEGMKIRPGKSFVEFIRGELSGADYVIMLVTPAYYESAFCMCELGGSWLQAKDAYPILVKPITYDNLKAVLHGVQCGKIEDAQDLNQLNDCLNEIGIGKPSAARWELRRDIFLGELPALVVKLQQRTVIPVADYEKLNEKYEGAQKLLKEHASQISTLKQKIEELKTLKDKDAVSAVLRKGMKEREQFDQLTQTFRRVTQKLPNSVIKTMYHTQDKDRYLPPTGWGHEDEWRELEEAQDRGLLVLDGGEVSLSTDDPKVKKALEALGDLETFLGNADAEVIESLTEEYDFQCSLRVRDFWQQFLGMH